MLGVAAGPAVHPREQRVALDAEERTQGRERRLDQLGVGSLDRLRIAGAAEERSHQHAVVGRAVRPLRRQPRRREDAGVLDPWDDETGARQRMADLVAHEGHRHGRRRGVGNLAGQARQLLVAVARQDAGGVGGRRDDHRPGCDRLPGGRVHEERAGAGDGVDTRAGPDVVAAQRFDQRTHHFAEAAGQRLKSSVMANG